MYNTIPNTTDLDYIEEFISLNLTSNALMFVMYHYIDLRLDCIDGTPGMTPEAARHHTMQWAREVHILPASVCVA
jgi:hypothetical protein